MDALDQSVICSIRSASVVFPKDSGGVLRAVDDVSFDVKRGEAIGIVGESGSGKSMLAAAMLGLVPSPGLTTGAIHMGGCDVLAASPRELYEIRGRVAGLVLQDPTASLNPVRTIGSQLAESARRSGVKLKRAAIRKEISQALDAVDLDSAEVAPRHSFELSGGMNQRVAIAMALIQRPEVLIADEPTTALDVTTQLGILELLRSVQRDRHMALVLISHDLGIVNQVCQRVAVMYAGRLVELGATPEVVNKPGHPYTGMLIRAIPRLGSHGGKLETIPGQLQPVLDDNIGCPFSSRCPSVMQVCPTAFPREAALSATHSSWCWLHHSGQD